MVDRQGKNYWGDEVRPYGEKVNPSVKFPIGYTIMAEMVVFACMDDQQSKSIFSLLHIFRK